MKKTIVYIAAVAFSVFVFFSFTTTINIKPNSSQLVEKVPIECDLFYNDNSNANSFVAEPFHASITRENIFNLSTPKLNKIKAAIAVMKSLPVSNKTSWAYQVGIHGGPSGVNVAWGTCQHDPSIFFLAWHRMYIYFFEKILRSKMAGTAASKPALPYWDYQQTGQNKIPLAFISPANTSNPLYNAMRDATMNGGGTFGSSISIDLNNAMYHPNFFTFQTALNKPHGAVHSALGKVDTFDPSIRLGDMNIQRTASNDPLFWIHHANVDRLWESWLQAGGSVGNPTATNNSWWNKEFVFFDENQNKIKMKGSQIVKVAAKLHYKYDNLSVAPSAARMAAVNIFTDFARIKLAQTANAVLINGRVSNYNFENIEQGNNNKTKNSDFSNIYVEFENIKILQAPSGIIEVYVNPKVVSEFEPTDNAFAGLLDLFSTAEMDSTHMKMEQEGNVAKISLDKIIKEQNLRMKDIKNIRLFFIARGNYDNNGEVLTTAKISIGTISIAQYLKN